MRCVSNYAVVSPRLPLCGGKPTLACTYCCILHTIPYLSNAKHVCAVQGSFPPAWRHIRRGNGVKVVCRGAATRGGTGCAHVSAHWASEGSVWGNSGARIYDKARKTMIRQFPTIQFLWCFSRTLPPRANPTGLGNSASRRPGTPLGGRFGGQWHHLLGRWSKTDPGNPISPDRK